MSAAFPDDREERGAVASASRKRGGAILSAALLSATMGSAQPSDLATLFPSQARIEAPVAGRLVRLPLRSPLQKSATNNRK